LTLNVKFSILQPLSFEDEYVSFSGLLYAIDIVLSSYSSN
jgi:hypothetical protein